MSRVATVVRVDLRVQGRHLFPQIYLVLTILYALLLRLTPLSVLTPLLLPIFLFSEPGLLGMLFTAAQHYFEQTQGVAVAVAVTPLRVREYVLGKALSISVLATAASVLLMALVAPVDARLLALVPAMWLTSVTFGLFGLGVAVHFTDFFRFLFAVMRLQGLLQLPALAIIGLVSRWWFIWLPSAPALYALEQVVQQGPRALGGAAYWAYLLFMAGWAAAALVWAERQYLRQVRGVPRGGRGGARRGGRHA
ncbi:MAG: hypothetical protein Q8P31_02765 [Bacillota bacterium]|nr:hypothetical protein [Bacillota bacterium]